MPLDFNPSQDIPDLTGKVILVTGGTTGVGEATVGLLAAHNPRHIYFTGRSAESGAKVVAETKKKNPNCSVTFIPCDLASSREKIRNAMIDHFKATRLDIFIANAGIMAVPPALTSEGYEIQFGTNHVGHAILFQILRPLMQKTGQLDGADVRFISLTSWGHRFHPPGGIQFDELKKPDSFKPYIQYGQSKIANIVYCKALAKKYPEITSVSVHPGLVRTALLGRTQWSMTKVFFKMLRRTNAYFTPEEGAYNSLWAATAPKSKIENGAYYEPVGKKMPGEPECNDIKLEERLWEWTQKELDGIQAL